MPVLFRVIEFFDETGQEMVHRVPEVGSGEFRLGDQLVVRESQQAVFFRDGKALDTIGPGRHTLSTANLPFLVSLLGAIFDGKSPFRAEVYFVNMREFVDQKWGTPEPVVFRDSDLGMVRLRGMGTYSTQIADPQLFVNKIVGTQGIYTTSQIIDFLRSILLSKLVDALGESKKGLFDLPASYQEMGAATKALAQGDFNALGIDLKTFYIQAITPTEETAKAIDDRAAMGAIGNMQAYLQYKMAQGIGAGAAPGEAGTVAGTAQAGMGLGAGIGLGAMMAGMMQQAMQPGAPGAQVGAMIICPSCSAQIPGSAKFCPNCGSKLAKAGSVTCPNCQAQVPAGNKFCSNCGNKIA